jgi:hypothetical protein
MIGSMEKRAMRYPMTNPAAAPITVPSSTSTAGGMEGLARTVRAVTMLEKAMVAPIERSMPR